MGRGGGGGAAQLYVRLVLRWQRRRAQASSHGPLDEYQLCLVHCTKSPLTLWRASSCRLFSGLEMLRRFQQAGWIVVSRRGSHVKVGRGALREVIPMHKELKKGLEHKLLKRLLSESQE